MITVRSILAPSTSPSATLTTTFTVAFVGLALILGDSKGRDARETNMGTNKRLLQTYLCLVHLNQLRMSVHLV